MVPGSPRSPNRSPFGRVLVVDQDAAFTRAVQRVLEPASDVVECNHPQEAMVHLAGGEEYDVILFGVSSVSATEFHDRIAEMNPALAARIVVLSRDGGETGLPNAPISTPFDPQTLRKRVAEFVRLRTIPPPSGSIPGR
jgi:CheY-like chemotaxis protein